MNLDDMKLFLLQLEASRKILAKAATPRAAVENGGSATTRPWQVDRCRRCDGNGHQEQNCKFRLAGLWFC